MRRTQRLVTIVIAGLVPGGCISDGRDDTPAGNPEEPAQTARADAAVGTRDLAMEGPAPTESPDAAGTQPPRDAATDLHASVVDGASARPDAGAEVRSAEGSMSFFVSSVGLGKGANLGGLAGADRHCRALAMAAGAKRTGWVAYLSAMAGPVHARDRIGQGPWHNARGQLLAASLDALHPRANALTERAAYIAARPVPELFLDERGRPVPIEERDILTGSTPDGRLFVNRTCRDWTSEADHGSTNIAQLGHVAFQDAPKPEIPSWNSARESAGCSGNPAGGVRGGRIYCFAAD